MTVVLPIAVLTPVQPADRVPSEGRIQMFLTFSQLLIVDY